MKLSAPAPDHALALFALALLGCASNEKAPAPRAAAPESAVVTPPALPFEAAARTEQLEPYSCGTVERLHAWNGIFAGSQPNAQDLRHAGENGVKTVINLRPKGEDPGFDEAALAGELGLEYHNIPFATPAELTDEAFEQARALLRDESKRPVFLHCHSGNRVGAIWVAFRVIDGGLPWDAALDEAKEVGLKSPVLEQRAREYVERVQAGAAGSD